MIVCRSGYMGRNMPSGHCWAGGGQKETGSRIEDKHFGWKRAFWVVIRMTIAAWHPCRTGQPLCSHNINCGNELRDRKFTCSCACVCVLLLCSSCACDMFQIKFSQYIQHTNELNAQLLNRPNRKLFILIVRVDSRNICTIYIWPGSWHTSLCIINACVRMHGIFMSILMHSLMRFKSTINYLIFVSLGTKAQPYQLNRAQLSRTRVRRLKSTSIYAGSTWSLSAA